MAGGPWEDFSQGPWSEFKPARSSAPIGDLPPDFGSAQVKPAELPASFNDLAQKLGGLPKPEEIAPALGNAFLSNAKEMANPLTLMQGAAGTGTLGDVGKTLLTKLTPAVPVASGLSGIATGLGNELIPAFGGVPDKTPADAANEMAQRLSYEPKTGIGKFAGAAIDLPFELYGALTRKAGEKVQDVTGSPLAATVADTGLQALPFLLGGRELAKESAPSAEQLRAQTSAPAAPQPSAAEGLKAMADGIKGEIDKALASQEAPQAPPAKPAVQPQAKAPAPAPEAPSGPGQQRIEASPVAEQPGASGPATGGDQPGLAQPPESPAVVPVSASAEPPAARVTPGVDKTRDVPLAGGVVEPTQRAPGHVAIDKDVPQWVKVPEHVNEKGETFPESWVDQHEEIDAHEKAEYPNIEKLGYQDAHDIHGNAATDAWARSHGMDPAVYKKAQAESIAAARKKAEQGNATDVNPNLDTRPYEDANQTHLLPDFTAEQRRESAAREMAGKVPGLTDEQKAQIQQHYPGVTKDRVTGFDRSEELDPTIQAVQASGKPGAYGEVDVRNLGGLNAHAGSNAKADVHLRAVADILRDEANKAGGNISLIRKSAGDEFGVVAHGMDKTQLDAVLERARQRINDYAKSNGLDNIPHSKGAEPGFGIHYGTSDIVPGASIRDILVHADTFVEQRKKGAGYEQRSTSETPGAGQGAERTAPGATAENAAGVGAADRAGESSAPAGKAEAAVNDEQSATRDASGLAQSSGVGKDIPAPRDTISVKNESVEADRLTRGVDAIASEQGPSRAESWQKAKDEAAKDPDAGRRLTQAILDGDKKALTQDEVALLLHDRVRISNEYRAAMDAHDSATTEVDKTAALLRLREAERQLDANDLADRKSGTETSLGLSARQMLANEDYSLARVGQRLKIAEGVDSIEKLPAAVKERMNDLVRQLDEANKKLEQQQSRTRGPRKTVDQRAQERLSKQMAEYEKTIAERLSACPI